MTQQVTENGTTPGTSTPSAQVGTDADVMAALGVGAPDEGQEPDDGTTPDDPAAQVMEDLPDWAQDEIKRLRRENANARVKAREAARKTATPPPAIDPATPPAQASEQAIRAAEERGRSAARMEFGVQLARAEVKAALAAILTDDQTDAYINHLDLSRLVQDDGSVDVDAVLDVKENVASLLATASKKPAPRVGHGRTTPAATQKSTAEQFADAIGSALG